jgi:uncharacterized protein (DUF58 family)
MIPATPELMVYPPKVDVSDIPLPMANMSGGRANNVNSSMAAFTIAGIRDYNVGDPLNRMAWSATARLGRMMVKEFDPEPTSDIWIILDLGERGSSSTGLRSGTARISDAAHEEVLEYAIAVAGSLAEQCLDGGRRVGMIINRAMPIRLDADSSQRQWFRIFETLAVASSFGERSLLEAIQADTRRFSRNSGLIVITANPASEWVVAARSLVQRQVPVTAALIDERSGGSAEVGMDELIASLADAHVTVARMVPGERFVATQRTLSPYAA